MAQAAPEGAVSAEGMRRVAWLDVPGGGQVTVEGGHAYLGHMKPPHGTSIVDVSDPKRPRVVASLAPPSPESHTHKVRVVGDLMVTNVERDERHALRRAERIPEIEAEHLARHGRSIADADLAAAIKVKPDFLPRARASLAAPPYEEGGFRVWDIRDRANPRLLAHHLTGGIGVHRFDMDERYAYISTEMGGYVGNILVIYDLADPERPREVSRWHMPGQHVADGETPDWPGQRHRLHHALRRGDTLWAAVWYAGVRAVDVSDIASPRTVGEYRYHPPFPEPAHTFFRVPFPLAGGREVAVAVDEEHDHTPGQLHGGLWLFDVADPSRIIPISMWHLTERGNPYVGRPGARFGAHQFQERMLGGDTCLYTAWFAGGLRVVDIADPERPREVAHWLAEPPPGQSCPQANDVDTDERGLVYVVDRNRGLEILERTG